MRSTASPSHTLPECCPNGQPCVACPRNVLSPSPPHCLGNSFDTPFLEWGRSRTSGFPGTSIYRGILTGYNAAFIVDQTTRDAFIAADPRSAELLKPILRGRDIARYRANWAGLWLIDTHNGYADIPPISVNDYPAVKTYLDDFVEHLKRRQDKGITPYHLRNCAYHEEFSAIKLLWKDMSGTGCFAYSDKEIYTNDKAFLMTGSQLKYLCAILNSSIASWYVSKAGLTTGMGLTQWKKYVVESIPVPDPGNLEQKFVNLVDSILQDQRDNDGKAQKEIDQLTFSIYGLTQGEQHQILGGTQQHATHT